MVDEQHHEVGRFEFFAAAVDAGNRGGKGRGARHVRVVRMHVGAQRDEPVDDGHRR